MTRIISALLVLLSSVTFAAHAADEPLAVKSDAPKRHVVVKGDTLWDISGMYLHDPFRWPELWGFNKDQIKNPHWIYPGQVLVLRYVDGKPRLGIEGAGAGGIPTVKVEPEVRATNTAQEIPAIPQEVIEPFLSQPLLVDESMLDTAPRIVATQYNRTLSGDNDLAYVTGMKPGEKQALWQIFRPGRELKDPTTGEVLGEEAIFLGTARLLKDGDPATIKVLNVKQETGKDDLLVKAPPPEIVNYPMHRPETAIDTRVVSIYGDSNAGGKYSIIAVAAGKKGGVDVGQVLEIARTGQTVTDRYRGHTRDIVLPDERLGLVYVFRVFDKVSYALVMETTQPVEVGDKITSP